MKDRANTLLLYGSGFRRPALAAGTLLGLLKRPPGRALPFSLHRTRFYSRVFPYQNLSYVNDWKDAFLAHPRLRVQTRDVMDMAGCIKALARVREFDLIVVLHSAAGDNMDACRLLAPFLARRKGRLAVFFGNEYDLVAQKTAFANQVRADFICSQLPLAAARFMWSGARFSRVLATPHALNPKQYKDAGQKRTIDVGFRGALYHRIIGDTERSDLFWYFQNHGQDLGLSCDVSETITNRQTWAGFLNQCHGILGAESGTYYLDPGGKTVAAVKKYLQKHPRASMEELHERYFSRVKSPVSGKAISSRHFEPIGTHTCQILLQGEYNGILQPDEHYIPVKKDLSDVKEAVKKFQDQAFREKITRNALEFALDQHTYDHRVEDFLQTALS